jgi:hypothetical protein
VVTEGVVRGERPAREEMRGVPKPKGAVGDYKPYAHPRYWSATAYAHPRNHHPPERRDHRGEACNLLGKREGGGAPLGKAAALREAKQWLRNVPARSLRMPSGRSRPACRASAIPPLRRMMISSSTEEQRP